MVNGGQVVGSDGWSEVLAALGREMKKAGFAFITLLALLTGIIHEFTSSSTFLKSLRNKKDVALNVRNAHVRTRGVIQEEPCYGIARNELKLKKAYT